MGYSKEDQDEARNKLDIAHWVKNFEKGLRDFPDLSSNLKSNFSRDLKDSLENYKAGKLGSPSSVFVHLNDNDTGIAKLSDRVWKEAFIPNHIDNIRGKSQEQASPLFDKAADYIRKVHEHIDEFYDVVEKFAKALKVSLKIHDVKVLEKKHHDSHNEYTPMKLFVPEKYKGAIYWVLCFGFELTYYNTYGDKRKHDEKGSIKYFSDS